jgi:uncharacterized membrane protein YkvA (DUF1232 family)
MASGLRVRDNVGYSRVVQQASQLSQDLRQQVAQAIEDATEEYGPDEDGYVRSKIDKKLRSTDLSSTGWVKELSQGFRTLYRYYRRGPGGAGQSMPEHWRKVGATLFYFINPFDIIPDHTPATGYLDDAFAFYFCVRDLPEDWDDDSQLDLD